MLLEAGAKKEIKNKEGRDPLSLAKDPHVKARLKNRICICFIIKAIIDDASYFTASPGGKEGEEPEVSDDG